MSDKSSPLSLTFEYLVLTHDCLAKFMDVVLLEDVCHGYVGGGRGGGYLELTDIHRLRTTVLDESTRTAKPLTKLGKIGFKPIFQTSAHFAFLTGETKHMRQR